ncbi:MAG: hypothetical protein HC836_35700 [Richelia sp. RM2_1_2]|nr:hypothetical protein [Richelia sp. RM1_1_1]NJO63371.1 hypothetical protein [Richelia sp. RM2_1_2]
MQEKQDLKFDKKRTNLFLPVIIILCLLSLVFSSNIFSGYSLSPPEEVTKLVALYLSTITGIFSRILWGIDLTSNKSIFRLTTFKPLLIAPFIVFTIYKLDQGVHDDVILVFLAFENGFFCESILDGRNMTASNNLNELDSSHIAE